MATDQAGPPGPQDSRDDQDARGSDAGGLLPTLPPGPVAEGSPVGTALLVVGSVVLGLAVAFASVAGDFGLVLAMLVAGTFGVVAIATGFRRFIHFFVAACVLRPLVDLTAGPRGGGVSVTEVFGAAVLGVMLLWLAVHRRELVKRLDRPLPIALLGMVVVYVFATLGSPDPAIGFSSTLRIAAGVAVFFVVDLLLATRRITMRAVLLLVGVVSVIPLLYPFLGVIGVQVTHQKDGFTALKSVFFLSNNLAHFLVPLLVVGAAWVLRTTGWHRVVAVGYCSLVGIELILSQTRGAWLGAVVGVLIVCALLDRRLLVFGAVAAILAGIFVPQINTRLTDLAPETDQPYAENSLTWRIDQWARLTPAVDDAPFLGGGPGEAVRRTGKEAHNDYVKAAVDTGFVGVAVYLGMVGGAIAVGWQALRRVRRLAREDPDSAAAHPWVEATVAGIAAYTVAAAAAAAGENLIDNVTFLWSALPLFALASWITTAPRDEITLEPRAPRPDPART